MDDNVTFISNKGKSIKIMFGDSNSGIEITYVKSRKEFDIIGWYDEFAGIQGGSISLDKFKEFFGIK